MLRKREIPLSRNFTTLVFAILLLVFPTFAQKDNRTKISSVATSRDAILWEAVDTDRDLYLGPGGVAMAPDLSSVKFIKKEKGGTQKKYRIEDGSGRIWIAPVARAMRTVTYLPETSTIRARPSASTCERSLMSAHSLGHAGATR